MKEFRADLHIHSVLSPCGDLHMSPSNIIAEAAVMGLDIIGITDHNSTRQCRVVKQLGEKAGIFVMTGAEITTKEEIHCLTFFESFDTLDRFQKFIDSRLPDFRNDPLIFGDQVVVDEYDNIVYTENRLLHNALDAGIDELEKVVHSYGGLFIPAHIDRKKNSIYSQLGIMPENLPADAIEISRHSGKAEFIKAHPEISIYPVITSSDAHFGGQIGTASTAMLLERRSFGEIVLAIKNKSGRRLLN